jgi:ferredoxin-nitrite reductase
LLKWVGVFFRRPTPGKFMMRVRMPNGFVRSAQLRVTRSLPMRLLQLMTQVALETI